MHSDQLVAILLPDGNNQFFSRMAQLIQRELLNSGVGMLMLDSDASLINEFNSIQWLKSMSCSDHIAAVIYIPSGDSTENFEALFSIDLPVIILDREIADGFCPRPIDRIYSNNQRGMQMVVNHLHDLGVQKVAYLSGPESTEPGRVRNRVFRESWESLGCSLIGDFKGDFSLQSGQANAQAMLRLRESPDAVVAANDLMAIGALQVLQESGHAVPRDLLLTGYDDIAMCSWIYPKLTSVRQNIEEVARLAALCVVKRIDGGSKQGSSVDFVEPELVIRGSTTQT